MSSSSLHPLSRDFSFSTRAPCAFESSSSSFALLSFASWSFHIYQATDVTLLFTYCPNHSLFVKIFTENLFLQSVSDVFASYYSKKQEMRKRIEAWSNQWNRGNPYSAFAIFKKFKNSQEVKILGYFILSSTSEPGVLQISHIFYQPRRFQKYADEAAFAIAKYALATIEEGYALLGKPLEEIQEMVLPAKTASEKKIEKKLEAYCRKTETESKEGSYCYSLRQEELRKILLEKELKEKRESQNKKS